MIGVASRSECSFYNASERAMPKFFIDTCDEEHFVRDMTGHTFDDLESAKAAAIEALPGMAADALPDGDARTFLAVVRGEQGDPLLQASLTLDVTAVARVRS